MLDRICIAVDGSDCSRRAADVGLAIADGAGAHVDVVHVAAEGDADATGNGDAGGDADVDGDSDTTSADSDVLADTLAEIDVDGRPVERHVLYGSPSSTIVGFADEHDVDLLVLGRRGLGGVGDRLLGSVVHAVLRNTDRPVLTVPAGAGAVEIDDVLVPTDGSDAAERAAPLAAAIAAQHDGTIHGCWVLDLATEPGAFSAGGMTEDEIDRFEAQGREHLDRLADRIRETEPGLSMQTGIVRDAPHAGIAAYVEGEGVDLAVASSTGESSAVGQVIGSVTDKLLEELDVPVLVVTGSPG